MALNVGDNDAVVVGSPLSEADAVAISEYEGLAVFVSGVRYVTFVML